MTKSFISNMSQMVFCTFSGRFLHNSFPILSFHVSSCVKEMFVAIDLLGIQRDLTAERSDWL